MPVSRTMSAARRYSVPSVKTGSPNGGELWWDDPLPAAAQSIRARLAEQAGARARRERNLCWGLRPSSRFWLTPAGSFRVSYPELRRPGLSGDPPTGGAKRPSRSDL
jgi:hypothetical protein